VRNRRERSLVWGIGKRLGRLQVTSNKRLVTRIQGISYWSIGVLVKVTKKFSSYLLLSTNCPKNFHFTDTSCRIGLAHQNRHIDLDSVRTAHPTILPTFSPSHPLTYENESAAKQRKPQFLISHFYFLISSSLLTPHSSLGLQGGH